MLIGRDFHGHTGQSVSIGDEGLDLVLRGHLGQRGVDAVQQALGVALGHGNAVRLGGGQLGGGAADDQVGVGVSVLLGHAAVHQWTHIGAHAMVQGGALLGQDLPPYVIVRNDTLRFAGINKIGLARRGFSHERIAEIHDACRILFQSGLNYLNGCDEVEKQVPQSPERDTLLEFIRTSKRGIIKPYESRCKEE